ncbi:MAG: hypothetical protein K0R03_1372 [Moraxellaceae bacterium]|jgi:uncharacterized repeat protein (TIGR01451 family)|nr:hypothetical protein [Moraxellaceae bacterium]
MIFLRHSFFVLTLLLASLLLSAPARADLIPRTITIDGVFTDWNGTGGTYDPAGDILTNTNQFSTDCQSGTACERDGNLSPSGRDFRRFAFTWDSNNIYFYVLRWQASSNITDWWFYMDTSGDNKMNTGERVMRVNWKGNGDTDVSLYTYTEVNAGGDSLTGTSGLADGYKMPGTISNQTALYSGHGGSGLEMESYVPWTSLGASGPLNMRFHIASSNGVNLPGSVIDNMEGPGANQLFPSDIQVEKTASTGTAAAGTAFSYTVTVRNLGYNTISNIVISDVLPADVVYVSHSASTGSYTDSNANAIPDRWAVGSVAAQSSATLTVNVRAANVTSPVVDTNTATLVSYTGLNQYTTNDSASVNVTINPGPLLSAIKTASSATVNPGQTLRYTVYVSNTGYDVATAVVAIDNPSNFTAFRLDTFGAGQHVRFTQGTPSSTLTLGTVQYSNDGGSTFVYTPVSGAGGAPAGHDGSVTHIRMPMTGSMAGNGGNFWVEYDVIVR